MRRCLARTLLFVCTLAGLPEAAANPSAGHAWVGDWKGTLELMGREIPLVFHVVADVEGTLTATMDSPSQGAFSIPADAVRATGDSLDIRIDRIAMRISGAGDPAGRWEGQFVQGGIARDLVLERAGASTRPQEPECPCPYDDTDVTFRNERAGITLAGTLTRPQTPGPHPAVVLVSGSGPQDRDASLFGHRYFLVFADHLARAGIAVLRFDERGVGESEGDQGAADTEILSYDTEAALEFLRVQDGVGPTGIIGHSEGGAIAPMVASRNDAVDFVVLMAGPGIAGPEVLASQARALAEAQGIADDQIEALVAMNQRAVELVAGAEADQNLDSELRALFEEASPTLAPEVRAMLQLDEAGMWIDANVRALQSTWIRGFVRFDPAPFLERTKVPVLAVNGSLDLQVLPDRNLAGIAAALERGGNDDVTVRELEGLNHMFQTATTGKVDEYAMIEETLAPFFLDTVTAWILERFGPDARD